jgi:predicted AAA+ superfamily ATPase
LIVRRAEAFTKSARRRLVQHPRYFFFDTGVLNGMLGNFEPSPDRIGGLMEHLVFSQIVHTASSWDREIRVSSFRTEHGAEVDFVVETGDDTWAIEVKASKSVGAHDVRGLERFRAFYGKKCGALVLYLGTVEKRIEHVDVLPWQVGLARMGL